MEDWLCCGIVKENSLQWVSWWVGTGTMKLDLIRFESPRKPKPTRNNKTFFAGGG